MKLFWDLWAGLFFRLYRFCAKRGTRVLLDDFIKDLP